MEEIGVKGFSSFEDIVHTHFDQKRNFMEDGIKYNLSDFTIKTRKAFDREFIAMEHVSGFWFSVDTLCKSFDDFSTMSEALRYGKTIMRTHICKFGKQIPHYTIQFN